MTAMLKNFFLALLDLLRPVLERTWLANRDKILKWQELEKEQTPSGMVASFNFLHELIFKRYFRRVRTVKTDIEEIKNLTERGPVVYVMKNRGQLEYRYLNHLFLKEGVAPVAYANNVLTVLWRPFKEVNRYLAAKLAARYAGSKPRAEADELAETIAKRRHALINLSISRDYLFGLFHTNPLARVKPLLDLQKSMDAPITIVPAQFLYDKQPEKSEKSLFDLLFGEKSRPGALRKIALFAIGLRGHPQAKFGSPIDLKEFLARHGDAAPEALTETLFRRIEESLAIERARITGPKLKSRDTIIDGILKDPAFIAALKSASQEDSSSYENARHKAREYLREIAADVNYSYVHFAWIALNYLWNNIFDGLVVKHDQLNRVREVAGKNPVVLVPMHRSHIDYLLISHIFYNNNITFPHICGGINLNFWPVGRLIRKCGGFFIRRRFEGNRLYKESLYAYIKSLVNQGYCLEFFIEGTRSRTGKMLKPKFGILGQIMRAFVEGDREDIHFVPIAINYDQIIEHKAYASEGAGAEKRSEGAADLIKARKVLGRKYGKVYVEFAEPISLKKFFEAKGYGKDATFAELKDEVAEFGSHLTYHMNKAAIVTPVALVSLAALSLEKRSFTFEELIERVHLLKDYLDYKEVRYSDLIHYSDRWAYGEALQLLLSRGSLREVRTFEGTFYALENSHRGVLDYYKNNILHFFVSLSCFLKIAARSEPGEAVPLEAAVKRYELLKTLLKNDFTFSVRGETAEHIKRVIRYCAEKGFVTTDKDLSYFTLAAGANGDAAALAALTDNFIESHLVTLRYLKHNRFQDAEPRALIRDILEKSRPLYLKDGDLSHPEALNRFNVENSLKFCADVGLVRAVTTAAGKPAYSAIAEPESVESWIVSVGAFLRARPAASSRPELPRNAHPAAGEDLH